MRIKPIFLFLPALFLAALPFLATSLQASEHNSNGLRLVSVAVDMSDQQQALAVRRTDPSGDDFAVSPLVESDLGAYFAATPNVSTIFFGGLTGIGPNAYSPGGTFLASGEFIAGTPFDSVVVELLAVDGTLTLTPWVALGQTGNSGEMLHTWRFDVGAFEAAIDPIDTSTPFAVRSAVFEILDSGDLVLGSFVLVNDISAGTMLGGAAVVTLVDGSEVPQDIAGFDVAKIVITWELEEALFVDGFESGDTTSWSP